MIKVCCPGPFVREGGTEGRGDARSMTDCSPAFLTRVAGTYRDKGTRPYPILTFEINAQLIRYFGNFVFAVLSL